MTKEIQKVGGSTPLPLFYKDPVVLRFLASLQSFQALFDLNAQRVSERKALAS